jgi:hypothetical protein
MAIIHAKKGSASLDGSTFLCKYLIPKIVNN